MNFNEAFYLEQNPDVREAVERGAFASGLAHYLAHGQYEGRRPLPESTPEYGFKDPVPPNALRLRVHGNTHLPSFEQLGKTICDNVCDAIRSRISLSDASQVLDFGCGCGRVMSYFRRSSPSALYGTDIDAEAINWCKSNMASVGSFSTNTEWPPLAFDDCTFDLVYAISVFTHLPEGMQTAWLEELGRVAKPGSYLLLSTHGEELLPKLTAQERERFAATGFLHWARGGTAGLPYFYQNTFHSEDYIHKHWSRVFEIEAIVKRGIANRQDLVVCKKPR